MVLLTTLLFSLELSCPSRKCPLPDPSFFASHLLPSPTKAKMVNRGNGRSEVDGERSPLSPHKGNIAPAVHIV